MKYFIDRNRLPDGDQPTGTNSLPDGAVSITIGDYLRIAGRMLAGKVDQLS